MLPPAQAGFIYYGVKTLEYMEKWLREDERRDIEEEIESTGKFISAYAGDVETSIDARTGQNITFVGGQARAAPRPEQRPAGPAAP